MVSSENNNEIFISYFCEELGIPYEKLNSEEYTTLAPTQNKRGKAASSKSDGDKAKKAKN
jgi:hypothetical protein